MRSPLFLTALLTLFGLAPEGMVFAQGTSPATGGPTLTANGVVVVPGRYIGPAFAAPGARSPNFQPQSYNLNFVTPPALVLANAPPIVTPNSSYQSPAPAVGVAMENQSPVGKMLSVANTPPGQPVAEPMDFPPPVEPSQMLTQYVPGSSSIDGPGTEPLPPTVAPHERSPQAPGKKSTIAGDIAALYAADALPGELYKRVVRRLPITVHVPRLSLTTPIASSVHVPEAVPSSVGPMFRERTRSGQD